MTSPLCQKRTWRLAVTDSPVTCNDLSAELPHAKLTPRPPRSRAFLMEPLGQFEGSAGRI